MLARPSTAELLAADLRREILDGAPAAGERLRERELVERYGVARHTLRAALRQLAAEGLVRIEPHRGATVARLGPEDVRWLYELRAALELEAAHLALERHGGRLPDAGARARWPRSRTPAPGRDPAWSEVSHAHAALHGAIVAASGEPAHRGRPRRADRRAAAVPAAAAAARRGRPAGRRPRGAGARRSSATGPASCGPTCANRPRRSARRVP